MLFSRVSFIPFHVVIFLLTVAVYGASAQDRFSLGVRDTPHLPPEEEQQQFKLPPGFEIQLVAAEPQIQKPLNMAFDARGRLWVTDTVEYPYAAPVGQPGRDSIKVIEFDYVSGKAIKVSTFADGLNIPIGLLPYGDGVIAHSIPNIWFFHDTDGDGKCDAREVLYGPFDYSRDTHGMENAFRRGFDGWIYACHGFNNQSKVSGKDGNVVEMSSGNTFRFKADGSRIEHFSRGQVNPFGMCFDPLFNIFTADCHSKPITQVMRGAYYPSFGKPHDGLGFVPSMMEHSHGSTAICGIVHVDGKNFPPEYRGNLLSGNVMTSRINRNTLVYHGSTIQCKEEPDFLSTGDPWFRPVDLQIGPDGALYIADFYNRIIGHYEVPLPHPGRDRTSGRIWRLVYKGDAKETQPATKQKNLSQATADELIAEFEHPVLGQRLLAEDELVNRVGKVSVEAVAKSLLASKQTSSKVHALWALARLSPVENADPRLQAALTAAVQDVAPEVRVHAMKVLSELPRWQLEQQKFASEELQDKDAFVVRAAADALGRHPDGHGLTHLLERLPTVSRDDNHLRHVIRMAIRDELASTNNAMFPFASLSEQDSRALASVAIALPNANAGEFLANHLTRVKESPDAHTLYLTHIARYAANRLPNMIELVRRRYEQDYEIQLNSLLALNLGLVQGGNSMESLVPWAEVVANHVLETATPQELQWQALGLDRSPATEQIWATQPRLSADGDKTALFYSSFPKGERNIGIYRSQAFTLPEKFSFWCAGHSGAVGSKTNDASFVRLHDAVTKEVLVEARAPRNDTAQVVEWNLSKYAGKQGYIEIVDGDAGSSYAWIAVGRFSRTALNPQASNVRLQAVAQLVAQLKLRTLKPRLVTLLSNASTDPAARGSLATALVAIEPSAIGAALVRLLDEKNLDKTMQDRIIQEVVARNTDNTKAVLLETFKFLSARSQGAVAETLAGDVVGAEMLLQLIGEGKLSPYLLQQPVVKQKLAAIKRPDLEKRAAELTASLPPANEQIEKQIKERLAAFNKAKPNAEAGAIVFTKHCAVCHQVAGKGAIVGPQLDGIGGRGIDRILEDILDPNRNVDVAFRTTTIVTNDGKVYSGLVRREEGTQLVFVNAQGKEELVNIKDIDERKQTMLSLMPANLVSTETLSDSRIDTLTPDTFNDLLAYLLQQKAKPKEK